MEVAAPAPYTELRLEDLIGSAQDPESLAMAKGPQADGEGKGRGRGSEEGLDKQMTVEGFLEKLKTAPQVCVSDFVFCWGGHAHKLTPSPLRLPPIHTQATSDEDPDSTTGSSSTIVRYL